MTHPDADQPPVAFGNWKDAEDLRRWSFLRRTPQQRLDWLVSALTIRWLAKSAARGARVGEGPDSPQTLPTNEKIP